ncbi:MAG TPA: hypothetical protein VFO10_22990 [Oligoflexus sp.]|uniref:hypothetical protein n=1 Tax=Oligoflexus sp. TaxID=1971216 RepID=UPI002D7F1CA6|nr:hypothetical protein [Oligoflexus sp.]HET9240148.1 hypothetical protein [Oligoflexus sp.]
MRIRTRLLFSVCAILSIQCSKVRSEDQRGLAGKSIAENPGEGDAVVEDMPKPGTDAVITSGSDLPPLKVGAEVDVTAMPPGFLDEISQISKISPTKTLLYSKSNIAWLLDEEKMGLLTKMQSAVTAPSGTRMYVQEGQHFWLFGTMSIAFPATKQAEDLGQVTLLNITPELMKDPQHKVLFVGPNSIILGAEGKANILTREGDKVRSLNLDLPKQSGQTVAVTAAGQGENQDLFWFLTAEQLLLLKRSENNQWNWRVAKFKVDPGVAGTPGQVAMMLSQGEKEVAFMGRTFVLNAGKLYEKDALKLSVPDEKAAAIAQEFTTKVAPILKNNCISCHPGYDTQAVATDKAAAYKTHLMNKTMPPAPNAPLSDADTKIVLDWYASIPL